MTPARTTSEARFGAFTTGARLFALLVLAPPVAFTQDYPTIVSSMLIGAVWMGATFADGLPRLNLRASLVIETSLVTFLVASSLPFSMTLVPALVIPQFIGGLDRGTRGALEALITQLLVLAATMAAISGIPIGPELLANLFTWLMAGLGFGLMGAVIRAAKLDVGSTTTSSYRDARALLTQLLELSDRLDDGLDPVTISQHIIDLACEEIPLVGVVVHARTPDGTVTVIDGSDDDGLPYDADELLRNAFERGEPRVERSMVALPIKTDAGVLAVLVARLTPGIDPGQIGLDKALKSLSNSLRHEALKLDTALIFSAVREAATTEERQRLAREMHDGVAQDLASFGYLIDDAAATAESESQVLRLTELRTELSSVIGELRRSVFSLRNEAARDRSLGERIAALGSHLQARSGIVIDVLRDEGDTRLRGEVESELLRIAQEGLNNAVRHARATTIQVLCTVAAPHARITVRDNGVGLGPARPDSHGVRIMRERAARIGADLVLTDTGDGTLLDVKVGPPPSSVQPTATLLEGSSPP